MGMESTQSSSARVVGYQGPGSQEGGCSSAKVPPNAKDLVPRKGGAVVLRCLKGFHFPPLIWSNLNLEILRDYP